MNRRKKRAANWALPAAVILIIGLISYGILRRYNRTTLEISSNKSGFDIFIDGERAGITRTDQPISIATASGGDDHLIVIADPGDDFYPLEFENISFKGGTIIPIKANFPENPPTIYLEYRGHISGMQLAWDMKEIGKTAPDGMFRGRVKRPRNGIATLKATDPMGQHSQFEKTVTVDDKEEIFMSYEQPVLLVIDSAYPGLQLFIDDIFIRSIEKGKTQIDHLLPDRLPHILSFKDTKKFYKPLIFTDIPFLGGSRQEFSVNNMQIDAANTMLLTFISPVSGMEIMCGGQKLGTLSPDEPLAERIVKEEGKKLVEIRMVDPLGQNDPWTETVATTAKEKKFEYPLKATITVNCAIEGLDIVLDGTKRLVSVSGNNRISGLIPDRNNHKLEIIDAQGRLENFKIENIKLGGGRTVNITAVHKWKEGKEPPLDMNIKIISAIEGLDILVDGENMGRTKAGEQEIKISRKRGAEVEITLADSQNRHGKFTKKYMAAGAEIVDFDYELKAAIKISDAPAGLEIILDGKSLGKTRAGETTIDNLQPDNGIHSLELVYEDKEVQRYDINLYAGNTAQIKPRPKAPSTRNIRLNVTALGNMEIRWCGNIIGKTGADGKFSADVGVPADNMVELVINDPTGKHESYNRSFALGQEKVLNVNYDKTFALTVEPTTVDNLGIYLQNINGAQSLLGKTSRNKRILVQIPPTNEEMTLVIKDDEDKNASMIMPINLRGGGAESVSYLKKAAARISTNKPAIITLKRSGSDDIIIRSLAERAHNVYQASSDNLEPGMYEIIATSGKEIPMKENKYLGAGFMSAISFLFVDKYISTVPENAEIWVKYGTFEDFKKLGNAPILKSDIDTPDNMLYIQARLKGYKTLTVQADLDYETTLILEKDEVATDLAQGDLAKEKMLNLKDQGAWDEAFKKAEDHYKKALAHDEKYYISRLKLAQLYFERLRKINKGPVFEKSVADCEKLLADHPEYFDTFQPSYTLLFYYYRGNIAYYKAQFLGLEKRKNLIEAIDYYDSARGLWDIYLARADGNVDRFAREEIIHNLAISLEQVSQNASAISTWRSLTFENDEFDKAKKEALERLTGKK